MGIWDDAASTSSSLNARARATPRAPESEVRPRTAKRRYTTLSEQSTVLAAHEARMNLAEVLELPDFRLLHIKHRTQRDRLLVWDQMRRKALQAAYARRKDDITQEYECLQECLSDQVSHLRGSGFYLVLTFRQHAAALSKTEDLHVMAEASLRTAQQTERRNLATALKHMEAYCRGESSNGESHNRTVTEQDRRELEKARWGRDNMDIRHQSAINVLRGEQSQRLKGRLQRQVKEIEQLETKEQKELQGIQKSLDDELRDWGAVVQAKKEKLQKWWALETEIWRKQHKDETGESVDEDLPPLAWEEKEEDEVPRISAANIPTPYAGAKDHGISTRFAVRRDVLV